MPDKSPPEKPETLDPETLAELEEAEKGFALGQGIPWPEAKELARKQYAAWVRNLEDLSA